MCQLFEKKLKALVRFGGELRPCTLSVNIFREDIIEDGYFSGVKVLGNVNFLYGTEI